jgi:hypothetical protein
MTATTSPDNLVYWTNSDPQSLPSASAAMMGSVQNALLTRQVRSYKWANSTAQNAETGMTDGDLGDRTDTNTLYRYDGTAWKILVAPSSTYPVGFTGLTVGNGATTSVYTQFDNTVTVVGSITFGSTTAITAPVYVSLPVAESTAIYKSSGSQKYVGGAQLLHTGSVGVPGFLYISQAQAGFAQLQRMGVSGGNVVQQSVSATQPFAWATGDIISWTFTYIRE